MKRESLAYDPGPGSVESSAVGSAKSLDGEAVGGGTLADLWPVFRRSGWWAITAAILSVGLLLVGFHTTLRTLWSAWDNNPNYSHGFLIPPISLFLVWRLRRELAATVVRSSWVGALFVFAGVLVQIVGLRGDVAIFQGYALLLTLTGLIWTWFGYRFVSRLAFPLAFLLFMVPVLPILMNQVSFQLKVVAANGSVWLAQKMGAEVSLRGMDLFFPSGVLTVENACSGLNSLIALMALGALFSHLSTGPIGRRWILFILAIPVAILANVVRITSLAVMAAVTDTETASGVFHDVGAFVLFGVALLLLAGCKRMLRC